MHKYNLCECPVCGFVYNERHGLVDEGFVAGTLWQKIPQDWQCPDCSTDKSSFDVSEAPEIQPTQSVDNSSKKVKPCAKNTQDIIDNSARYQLWECIVCGLIYDEALGWPEDDIAPGTRWEDIPEDWECPDCLVGKEDFELLGASESQALSETQKTVIQVKDSENHFSAIDYNRKPLIIIGAGLAGYNLAKEVRKLDPQQPIVIISADQADYYSKPLLSTGFAQNKTAEQIKSSTAEQMAEKYGLDILILNRVTEINSDQKVITIGRQTISYENLVFATGSSCISPPVGGNGLGNLYHVNDLTDYHRFRTAMVNKKRILVIGAGLIGSEYANDLISSGYQVDVVDPVDRVLAKLLPEAVSEKVQQSLTKAGVNFHFGCVVNEINQADKGVVAILSNGEEIHADLVLSAVGVKPRTDLAKQTGLEVNRGIVVDQQLKTSTENIYALGDCAEVHQQVLFYIEPLMRAVKALAQTLTGKATEVIYNAMPVSIKTTLCPITICPPKPSDNGTWQYQNNDNGIIAHYVDSAGKLLGFALTEQACDEKETLAKQLNNNE